MSEHNGIYRASVYDVNDPEERGRLRMLVPSVLGAAVSAWAEPMLPASEGIVWQEGDRVWVLFEGGDLNRPVYLSRMEVTTEDLADGSVTPEKVTPGVVIQPVTPPATSPPLTVTGMPDTFLLRTAPVAATTRLRFQVSRDYVTVGSGSATWTDLPGMPVGTTILPVKRYMNGAAEESFQIGVDYAFRVRAENNFGSAPYSNVEVRQLDTNVVDTVVQTLIALQVYAGFGLFGGIQVGGDNFTLTPPGVEPSNLPGGLRILTSKGTTQLPADGSSVLISGGASLDDLDVQNGMTLSGKSSLYGGFNLSRNLPDPLKQPDVHTWYPNRQFDRANLTGWARGDFLSLDNTRISLDLVNGVYVTCTSNSQTHMTSSGALPPGALGITRVSEAQNGNSKHRVLAYTEADEWLLHHVNGITPPASLDLGVTADASRATLGSMGEPQASNDLVAAVEHHDGTSWSGTVVMTAFHIDPDLINEQDPDEITVLATLSVPSPNGPLAGVSRSGDGTRWYLQPVNDDIRVYDNSGVRQPSEEWPRPFGKPVRGLYSLTSAGVPTRYMDADGVERDVFPGLPGGTYWFSYAWVNIDLGGAGETTLPSPERQYVRPKGSYIRVVMPLNPAPDEHRSGFPVITPGYKFFAATTAGGTKHLQYAESNRVIEALGLLDTSSGGAPSANTWTSVVGEICAEIGDLRITGQSGGDVGSGAFAASIRTRIPATTSDPGVVELATDDESLAGTDTTRAVTPKGLATVATNIRDRSTHTGTQTSASISDFAEAAQDAVAAALSGVTGATVSYDDNANTITITGLGDPETMRDVIGTALVGVGVVSVVVNDSADTITISSTATQNATDAALRDRSTHTGTQAASTITGLAAVATSGAKADVGLGNVDNTSDANKPVSTAQQTALDSKQNAHSNLTELSGLTLTANKVVHTDGGGVLTTVDFTALAVNLAAISSIPTYRSTILAKNMRPGVNTITNASYTIAATDEDVQINMNTVNGTAQTLTLPSDTAVTIPTNFEAARIVRLGPGAVSIVSDGTSVINSRVGAAPTINGQYGVAFIKKRAANTWLVWGDIV